MNVTFVPKQIGPGKLAAIVTLGVTGVVTDIDIGLETAVTDVTHANVEVITTVTSSPFTSVDDEKVAPVPAFIPFIFH